jgi:toxin ParE1/3/4
VPAEFWVEGYVCRSEQHMIDWRVLANGDIGVVTILHQRMRQIARLRDEFE